MVVFECFLESSLEHLFGCGWIFSYFYPWFCDACDWITKYEVNLVVIVVADDSRRDMRKFISLPTPSVFVSGEMDGRTMSMELARESSHGPCVGADY